HFQWGRKADGHELTTYTSPTSGSITHPDMTCYSDYQLHTLNDPCPEGNRVPTKEEWDGSNNILPSKIAQAWQSDELHLTYAGYKNAGGFSPNPGSPSGWYCSSSPYGSSDAWYLYFVDSDSSTSSSNFRYWGRPLRCSQD
ncbi:hypothetical protein ACQ1P5_11725, partial [Ornithobacterium rhinotracheale]